MATKKVYLASLYRFGYNLEVVEETEAKAQNAMIAEYVKAYKARNNGADPSDDERYDGETYLSLAIEDIAIYEMEFGKVEWR